MDEGNAGQRISELKQHFPDARRARQRHAQSRCSTFGHNYNYVSRAACYSWLNQHLKLGLKEPIVEEDYKRLSNAEMSVWDDQHPKPESGPETERKLLRSDRGR